ncbi:carbohydrate ABC transporter permease [Cellulomonas fimi]|uniref:Binding-protein-dependent transport systems inner membrane component n=1 Tax=Cellulomonas fimi (strain ATCC 484 / DSM 20113 / JCM 1341 / CCUG 24087 / LMG 16345 / NBRC 15513 / NCIMB 8980 / NCTC 7547 / NRS-133) TaxID=590998 RepID=F4H0J5_CELFA|nr:carbohydrate ABC transporter permease [Cellulomonas fimi]AEE47364.1 binding-protein-dependent transport systems inner membrane component [Cellulomonas fimi ATCC 484]NNH05806.1 carbohydrate ABC transporter permease [Cellulomonas fimi]VEH36031.1 Inner membrane ABC transporter permease protein ycjP [Cellulomonas fimi]
MTTTVTPQPNAEAAGAVVVGGRRRRPQGRLAHAAGLRVGEHFASPGRILAILALVALAVFWLLPFLWAVFTSFKSETAAAATPVSWLPSDGFTADAYTTVLREGNIPLWTWNSLLTSVTITAVTLAVSSLAAYALARIDFRGRKWLFWLIIASIIVPPPVLIVPLFYEMLTLNLVDTYGAIILPQLVHPAMVFVLKKFFEQVPVELEDAARIDGAGRLRVFWSVVLPLSRPILAAVSIIVFIGAWNNFLWPFIITSDASLMTLPVGLQTVKSAYGLQYAQTMASAVLAALPLIVVFLFFQRQIIKGFSTTGFGGQ